MPPVALESTWAGDYHEPGFETRFWHDEARKPYLIHWAGMPMDVERPIHQLFYQYTLQISIRYLLKGLIT